MDHSMGSLSRFFSTKSGGLSRLPHHCTAHPRIQSRNTSFFISPCSKDGTFSRMTNVFHYNISVQKSCDPYKICNSSPYPPNMLHFAIQTHMIQYTMRPCRLWRRRGASKSKVCIEDPYPGRISHAACLDPPSLSTRQGINNPMEIEAIFF